MFELQHYLNELSEPRRGCALSLIDYLLGEASAESDPDRVMEEIARRLVVGGVPLDRMASIVRLLHAEAGASIRKWDSRKGVESGVYAFRPNAGDPRFDKSPSAVVQETGEWLELWIPDTPDERFELVADLKSDGITSYILAPVFLRNGLFAILSFGSAAPNGFNNEDRATLRAVYPALSKLLEILTLDRVLGEVTRIYVGEEPKKRILSGDVHRGEVLHIRSAILFADMRRFTEMTANMSAENATELLNRYYDCVVPQIEAEDGEVLKFIADGVLAIFRDEGDAAQTCARAVRAARAGLDAVHENRVRPRFEVGMALHFGEVAYGNVGSGMRLDYTVIGRDVNLAARVAGLCGSLGAPLLVSERFAATVPDLRVHAAGVHLLKGLANPAKVFAVI